MHFKKCPSLLVTLLPQDVKEVTAYILCLHFESDSHAGATINGVFFIVCLTSQCHLCSRH